MKRLYFDTITHSPMALEYLVRSFGADDVLLVSDYPYDMGDPEPVGSLRATGIDNQQIAQIAASNGCKLSRIGT
jgi:aminocarboxymuconate-semialdehyde decarboxylase